MRMAPSSRRGSTDRTDQGSECSGLSQDNEKTSMISATVPKGAPSSDHSVREQSKRAKDKGRFTVSPVHLPHSLLRIEEEPLLRNDSNYSTLNTTTGLELANQLMRPGSSEEKKPSRGTLTDDEGFLENYERQRHDTAVSESGTTDTFLDEDEPPLPAQPHVYLDAQVLPLVITTLPVPAATSTSVGCYDNNGLAITPSTPDPAINLSDETLEATPSHVPPVIMTSHPSETSLLPPLPESAEASRWELNGPRNPNVQFYVGSCLSVSSAASHVSFYNTLYAHGYTPICRLCHQPATAKRPLTSPCNCVGSLRFVHHSCLMRWVNMRTKQLKHNPKCELCGYQFRAYRSWRSRENVRWPSIPLRDKLLHGVFFCCLALMLTCIGMIASVVTNVQTEAASEGTKETPGRDNTTLACGILFFIGFFGAAVAQIKANWSLWKLVRLFWENNYVLQLEDDLTLDPVTKRQKLVSPA